MQDDKKLALRDGHAIPRRRRIEFDFGQLLAAVGGSGPQHAAHPTLISRGQIVFWKRYRRASDEELIARHRNGLARQWDIDTPTL